MHDFVTYLVSAHDNRLVAIVALQHGLGISALAIRAPVRLLGVIRLEHVGTLHLQGDAQIRRRIRIRLTRFA